MARRATGTIEWVPATSKTPGHWKARIRFADGSRPWIHFPPEYSESEARLRAESLAGTARDEQWVSKPNASTLIAGRGPDGKRETLDEWMQRWFTWREARQLRTVRDDRSRYKHHIAPFIGPIFVDALTRDDLENVRDDLDRKILEGYVDPRGKRKRMKWRMASNVWTVVTSFCRDMKGAKERALRCREDDLAAGIQGPERGDDTSKTYLYPNELRALLSDVRIPLHLRRAYALGTYLYLRLEELAALEWRDVDLEHGYVHVRRAEKSDGTMGPPKNGKARKVPIEASLRPLLVAMWREAVGDDDDAEIATVRVARVTQKNDAAAVLRRYLDRALRSAKLTQRLDELITASDTTKPLGFHDLRATGITWRAVRGDAMQLIRQHAGHQHISTTDRYVREADGIREGFGTVFPPLPASLLAPDQVRAIGPNEWSENGADLTEGRESPREVKCQGRGSNPHALSGRRF